MKQTPEQRAEDAHLSHIEFDNGLFGHVSPGTKSAMSGCATCIREEVEPLEARVAELEEQLLPTAKVFDRIRKRMDENPESTRASFDKVNKEYIERFEKFKQSLSAGERLAIIESYADKALSDHLFGQPAMDQLNYMEWVGELREAEAENAKLRALVQDLVDALDDEMFWSAWLPINQMDQAEQNDCIADGRASVDAMNKAKEQGFVPTNTTEG